MGKIGYWVSRIFAAIGVLLLAVALFLAIKTIRFVSSSELTTGVVVDIVSISSGTIDRDYTPVVRYVPRRGDTLTYQPTWSSSFMYPIGQRVPVYFNPNRPEEAEIKSFTAQWFGTMISFLLGAVYGGIGGGMLLHAERKRRLMKWLKQPGNAECVKASIISVRKNTSYSENNIHPFHITCQWTQSATKRTFLFKSENMWFDPTPYLTSEMIDVLINPQNPRQYWVDISFLLNASSS